MISNELKKELHQIIKDDYKTYLSKKEVFNIAEALTQFYELLLKIEGKYEYDNENNRSPNR